MVKTHWEYHTHLIADQAYFECKVSFLWTYEHTEARFLAVKPLSLCLCSVWVIFTSAVADVGEQSVWKRGRSMWTSQSLHVCAELSEEVIRLKDVWIYYVFLIQSLLCHSYSPSNDQITGCKSKWHALTRITHTRRRLVSVGDRRQPVTSFGRCPRSVWIQIIL